MENKKLDFTKLIKKTFKENNKGMTVPKKNVKSVKVQNSFNKKRKKNENKKKDNKRYKGQYFTYKTPFSLNPFMDWFLDKNLRKEVILEPFSGKNNLIDFMQSLGFANRYLSFDIEPKSIDIVKRDTIKKLS